MMHTKNNADKVLLRHAIYFYTTLLFGILSTVGTVVMVSINQRHSLMDTAQSLSAFIEPEVVQTLKSSPDVASTPEYNSLKQTLQTVQTSNKDLSFLYLMVKNEEGIYFIMDSEDPTSEDYSPPGMIYEEASPALSSVFSTGKGIIEFDGDRWGIWVSSIVPIIEPQTGEVVAVFGIDEDFYSQYLIPVIAYGMLPFSLFTCLFIMVIYNKRKNLAELQAMKEKDDILSIVSHEVRTPITQIRWSYENLFEEYMSRKQTPVLQALSESYVTILQIIQRMNNLDAANEISEKKQLQTQPIELSSLLHSAVKSITFVSQIKQVDVVFKE